MLKTDVNLLFLSKLAGINQELKHTSSGSNGRHPLLRVVILKEVQDDIRTFGWTDGIYRWRHYLGLKLKHSSEFPVPIDARPLPTYGFSGRAEGGAQLPMPINTL